MSWRATVLSLMRVPHEPEPPPGSPPLVFRAAPNFYTLRVLRWSVLRILALAGLLFAAFAMRLPHGRVPAIVVFVMHAAEAIGWIAFLADVVLGWTIVRLDYELRWYMLSDRAIRIREGIAVIREKTIALANVQNISIRQGPLQRLLGIADVEVKTAGGGGSSSEMEAKKRGGEPMHVAYFRGVDNASRIRDLVREGVRNQRNAGLGDLDDHHAPAPPPPPQRGGVRAAAQELLAEARALRLAVGGKA